MTIILYPIVETEGESYTPDIHSPDVETAFDEYLLAKTRAVKIRQKCQSSLVLDITDEDGRAVDLSELGFSDSPESTDAIECRFRDSALADKTIYKANAIVQNAEAGKVKIVLPSSVRAQAGIYLAEIGVFDVTKSEREEPLFTNELYVYNEHSAWGSISKKGPPTVADFRLSLRDNSIFENELFQRYGYGLVEIAYAATRVVQYWNEQLPIVAGTRYSTFTFPHRSIWLLGGQLFLYQMAEEYYRRNHLPYNAGNVAIDDLNKFQQYNAAWRTQFELLQQQIIQHKVRANFARCYGRI